MKHPQTPEGVNQWLRELGAHEPEWWENVDNQFQVVLAATQHFGKLLSPIMLEPLIRQFSEKSKTHIQRTRAIFRLHRVEDMRRALKWPGVLPLDRSEPGSELYPSQGWIAHYLLYAQGSEIPTAWHFWFAVALLGAAMRRNVWIDMGTWTVYPYWYMMVIEETASAKSTAFSIAKDMMGRHYTQLRNEGRVDCTVRIAAQSATLAAFLDDVKSELIANPLNNGELIQRESCIVLPVDEIVTLLGKTKHNPDEWIWFLTDLFGYTGDEWVDRKVSAGLRTLYRPAISFWAGSTLEWVQKSVTEDMFAGGFLGRFVFIRRKGDGKSVPRAAVLDPVWAEDLASYLVKLSKMDPTEFTMTPAALDWHDDWYHKNKELSRRFEGEKFQAYWRRKQSHLLRLAMCLCVAEGRFQADIPDLELAQKLLALEEAAMEGLFASMGAHPEKALCDFLLKVINKEGKPIAYAELLRMVRYKTGSAVRTKELLHTLISTDEIRISNHTGPRGGHFYEINKFSERAKRRLEGED